MLEMIGNKLASYLSISNPMSFPAIFLHPYLKEHNTDLD